MSAGGGYMCRVADRRLFPGLSTADCIGEVQESAFYAPPMRHPPSSWSHPGLKSWRLGQGAWEFPRAYIVLGFAGYPPRNGPPDTPLWP